tara:strand:- start:37 stop:627 length:591 start_codon:yes stop_codon:yes gene_type:complete
MLKLFLILNLIVSSAGYKDLYQTSWKLKKEENNIKIFLRKTLEEKQEYLAETIINKDMNSIYKEIIDYNNSHKWMYKLESSKILDKKNDSLFYVQFTMEMSWPLKKRDLVSDVKITKNKDLITISLESTPDYIESSDDFIRIDDSKSKWILSKIDNETTKVSLQSYAIIDGIPSFIVDMFIVEGPLFSLSNLKSKF